MHILTEDVEKDSKYKTEINDNDPALTYLTERHQ